MTAAAEPTYMRRALELAEQGRGKTSPNPMVGAVVVKKGKIIGEGYHRKLGHDHAEIVALKSAGKAAKGATLYVTLEPCCHVGRTGPCTEAIIRSGIARVVVPMRDPNPVVNGKGIKLLRQAGIEVKTGLMRHEAARLNDAYVGYFKLQRPYVVLKTAQTLDGRIAANSGDSKWISSGPSRKFAHRLRAEADAVVIGSGTLAVDNPLLTVRHVNGTDPYRIILTGSGRISSNVALLKDNKDLKTIVVTSKRGMDRLTRSKSRSNLVVWQVGSDRRGNIDLNDFLEKADVFGLRSMLVEGGAKLATSFLRAGLVDKYVAIMAPKLLGDGVNAVGNLDNTRVSEAIEFNDGNYTPVGPDIVFTGYPKRK